MGCAIRGAPPTFRVRNFHECWLPRSIEGRGIRRASRTFSNTIHPRLSPARRSGGTFDLLNSLTECIRLSTPVNSIAGAHLQLRNRGENETAAKQRQRYFQRAPEHIEKLIPEADQNETRDYATRASSRGGSSSGVARCEDAQFRQTGTAG